MNSWKLVATAVVSLALSACSTSSESNVTPSASAPAASAQAGRTQLSRAEIVDTYSGRTLRGAGHSTTYNADGTWTNSAGRSGRWTVSNSGVLRMTGGVNIGLQIFSDGDRYYHRNTSSGQGGYYTI
ncbi:hypothetical protein [Mesorhizobium sp. CAU 1741]|uniref:hypothetical protein n=1 Tax=Mesorhizobium sp. CAU 1741 TaxID=3140366 RepID=UPI00325C1462